MCGDTEDYEIHVAKQRGGTWVVLLSKEVMLLSKEVMLLSKEVMLLGKEQYVTHVAKERSGMWVLTQHLTLETTMMSTRV